MPKTGSLTFGDIEIDLSNTDRVMFDDVGITKREVIDYYKDVADLMVPSSATARSRSSATPRASPRAASS